MTNKVINTIRFSIKSNNIVYGEQLINSIRLKKVYVVLLASDASNQTIKKIKDKSIFYNIPVYEIFDKETFFDIFHKPLVAFGIKDLNLSTKLIKNLQEGSESHEEKN